MNKLAMNGDKRMTVREVSQATGIGYSTVCKYAHKAGWTAPGKTTYLTETQVTLLLEAMKQPVASGRLANSLFERESLETDLSDEMQLAMKYKEIASLERKLKEKAITRAEQAEVRADVAEAERDYERTEHNGTKRILAFQVAGNKHHQNMLEALGAVKTDREDMLDTYRREK